VAVAESFERTDCYITDVKWWKHEMAQLNAEEARIFRITHIDNVPWILRHGLHCKSSGVQDPNFIQIGSPELIRKRASRAVPIKPKGLLSDYVPFYFTPWSIMMYNIKTGYNGITHRPNHEIAIMVSSVHKLAELGVPFVFTNAHAYMLEADYFDDVRKLEQIDWELLRSRNFKNDPDKPEKQARYQAEALVYKHVPIEALLGIACYDESSKAKLESETRKCDISVNIKTVPDWYF
jgi:hypothetical protein